MTHLLKRARKSVAMDNMETQVLDEEEERCVRLQINELPSYKAIKIYIYNNNNPAQDAQVYVDEWSSTNDPGVSCQQLNMEQFATNIFHDTLLER